MKGLIVHDVEILKYVVVKKPPSRLYISSAISVWLIWWYKNISEPPLIVVPAILEYGQGDWGCVDSPMFLVVYAAKSVPLTQNPKSV